MNDCLRTRIACRWRSTIGNNNEDHIDEDVEYTRDVSTPLSWREGILLSKESWTTLWLWRPMWRFSSLRQKCIKKYSAVSHLLRRTQGPSSLTTSIFSQTLIFRRVAYIVSDSSWKKDTLFSGEKSKKKKNESISSISSKFRSSNKTFECGREETRAQTSHLDVVISFYRSRYLYTSSWNRIACFCFSVFCILL